MTEQDKFESWASLSPEPPDFSTWGGVYIFADTRLGWQAWRESRRRALEDARSAVGGLVDEDL